MSDELINKLDELIDAVNALAKSGGRTKSVNASFSEKIVVKHKRQTHDFIVSIGLGKELPFDMGKKEMKATVDNLEKSTMMLVEKWGDGVLDSVKKKIEEDE